SSMLTTPLGMSRSPGTPFPRTALGAYMPRPLAARKPLTRYYDTEIACLRQSGALCKNSDRFLTQGHQGIHGGRHVALAIPHADGKGVKLVRGRRDRRGHRRRLG